MTKIIAPMPDNNFRILILFRVHYCSILPKSFKLLRDCKKEMDVIERSKFVVTHYVFYEQVFGEHTRDAYTGKWLYFIFYCHALEKWKAWQCYACKKIRFWHVTLWCHATVVNAQFLSRSVFFKSVTLSRRPRISVTLPNAAH